MREIEGELGVAIQPSLGFGLLYFANLLSGPDNLLSAATAAASAFTQPGRHSPATVALP